MRPHFLRKLLEEPAPHRRGGALGAVSRARHGARRRRALRDGLVIELGPGTGPVTKALIEHGVARERLVLVEYDPSFCRLLAQRFAPARVVQGDAYDLPQTLAAICRPARSRRSSPACRCSTSRPPCAPS